MGKLIYVGGSVAFSTLRSFVECGGGGYTNMQAIRGRFFLGTPSGTSSTGNFSGNVLNQWINSRCWSLTSDGGGTVSVISPWNTGYAYNLYYDSMWAVANSYDSWVTINASANSNYTFSYWYRVDPYELWSYNSYVSYYIPTNGWQDTYRLTAVFNYSPPPPTCYYYELYAYDYYAGYVCGGGYQSGYTNGYGVGGCFSSLDYGGYNTYNTCLDPNCLVKGTSIEMADGTHKLIEKIRLGDVLKGIKISDAPEDDTIVGWSTNTLNLVETEVRVVSIVPISCTKTYIFNEGLIESTPEHAHFIKREDDWFFEQSRNVQIGDFLVDKQGNSVEITSIQFYEHTEEDSGKPRKVVYDMNVENTDTYIANGLITHNPIEKITPQ